jgi:hypothetical protein
MLSNLKNVKLAKETGLGGGSDLRDKELLEPHYPQPMNKELKEKTAFSDSKGQDDVEENKAC